MTRTAASGVRPPIATAWPDLLAFAGGLALAWFGKWETTDLVWSLWLSSFVVGYSLIVWSITRPLREMLGGWTALGSTRSTLVAKAAVAALFGVGTLFGLAFFTVHFGGFHYIHSVFLNSFFPITSAKTWPTMSTYLEVLSRYWYFLPLAFLAERRYFRTVDNPPPDDGSVTVEAIKQRMLRNADSPMTAPYKGVMRMHMLIFFFVFAHFTKLDGFPTYAVVYAVYFFPWSVLKHTGNSV